MVLNTTTLTLSHLINMTYMKIVLNTTTLSLSHLINMTCMKIVFKIYFIW